MREDYYIWGGGTQNGIISWSEEIPKRQNDSVFRQLFTASQKTAISTPCIAFSTINHYVDDAMSVLCGLHRLTVSYLQRSIVKINL